MYDVIKSIINHTWVTGSISPGDQTTLYYICGAMVLLLTIVSVDVIRSIFSGIRKH